MADSSAYTFEVTIDVCALPVVISMIPRKFRPNDAENQNKTAEAAH
jgi:hypothetical protein